MESDIQFYEHGAAFPAAYIRLAGSTPRGEYTARSVTRKRLERRIDLVLKPGDPEDDFWIVECHGKRDREAERNLFLKAVLFAAREGAWGRVRSLVVYTTAQVAAASLPPRLGQDPIRDALSPVRVVLGELEPEALLARGPALFPLLPFTKVDEDGFRRGIPAWWEEVLRSSEITASAAREIWSLLTSFAMARFPCATLSEIEKMLGGRHMHPLLKTRSGQEYMERLLKRGKKIGRKIGKKEGMLESILQALEFRFGQVPDDFPPALAAIGSHKTLLEVLRLALSARSWRTFRARFEKIR